MCQLLGVSSNKPVDIKISLKEFRFRGEENPHGFGFGFLDHGAWKILKQPESLAKQNLRDQQFRFSSRFIIGHVRLASCGGRSHQNTHPFSRNGWIFAHNGTVASIKDMPMFKLRDLKPEGDTDSEYAFCYILEQISKNHDIDSSLIEIADSIRKHGNFNFILSNGISLYAYGHNSLYFVKRSAPFKKVELRDAGYEFDLNEIKATDEIATLVATEPLTYGEEWQKITGLRVFRNGEEIKQNSMNAGHNPVKNH